MDALDGFVAEGLHSCQGERPKAKRLLDQANKTRFLAEIQHGALRVFVAAPATVVEEHAGWGEIRW